MEGNIHAALLLSTVVIGAVLCWRYRGMPSRRWQIGLRVLAAPVVLVAVWAGSAGMFQCMCGPGNNPTIQGLLPAFMAAAATIVVRDWKPRLAAIALLFVLAYGLSWQFHSLVLPESRENQRYTGDAMFDERPAEFWHTQLTGLYRYIPPPPNESELHRAARGGDLAKVRSLIEAGAPLDQRSRDGNTALQLAARGDAREIVEALLDAGAAVDATDYARETALHSAARAGAFKTAEFLLSRGAAVNARSTNGATPLCNAASPGHRAVVELLVANGADINLKESSFTPLYLAVMYKRNDVAEFLMEKGAGVNNGELAQAVFRGQKKMALALIARGADINAERKGDYPLLVASRKGNLEMVQMLIEHGANVNVRSNSPAAGKNGWPATATALQVAGSDQVRQYLVSKGAR